MIVLLTTLLILLCLAIVLLILIQRTSGGMGSALGGGAADQYLGLVLLHSSPSLLFGEFYSFSCFPLGFMLFIRAMPTRAMHSVVLATYQLLICQHYLQVYRNLS